MDAPAVDSARIAQAVEVLKRGGLASGNTPTEFAAFVKSEVAKWTVVAKAAKVQID